MTMVPKFALVKFKEDSKIEIVRVKDISKFDPKNLTDYSKSKLYNVLWPMEEDEALIKKYEGRHHYEAVILCLSLKKEDIDLTKRYSSLPVSQLLSASESEPDNIAKSTHLSKVSKSLQSEEALKITLKERLASIEAAPGIAEKRNRSLDTSFISLQSDDDEEEVEVTVKKQRLDQYISNEMQLKSAKKRIKSDKDKYETLQEKLEKMEVDMRELQGENDKLQGENDKLQGENDELQGKLSNLIEINYQLQVGLLSDIKKLNSRVVAETEEPTNPSAETTAFGDIFVDNAALRAVEGVEKDPVFVKDLAVLIWSKAELMNRSVCGKVCPIKRKDENSVGKPALTPAKLQDLKAHFKKRLISKGFADPHLTKEVGRVNRYIGEKICDLQKAKKRLLFSSNVSEHVSIPNSSTNNESPTV